MTPTMPRFNPPIELKKNHDNNNFYSCCYLFFGPYIKNKKNKKNYRKKTKKYSSEKKIQGCRENGQRLDEEVKKYKD
jgi:hypothetical protein